MPPQLALVAGAVFILLAFRAEKMRGAPVSSALVLAVPVVFCLLFETARALVADAGRPFARRFWRRHGGQHYRSSLLRCAGTHRHPNPPASEYQSWRGPGREPTVDGLRGLHVRKHRLVRLSAGLAEAIHQTAGRDRHGTRGLDGRASDGGESPLSSVAQLTSISRFRSLSSNTIANWV
jgi:hypothetical protein